MVNQILLDTGCSRRMVRRHLVPHAKMLEGKMVSIKCAHGDTVLYPLAVVDMEVEGIPVHVEAAVVDTLPVGVLLGTDVSELPRLLGEWASYGFFSQEDVMVVMTRARKKQELQKEILLKEKEALSGVVPKPLNTQGVSTPRTLSQEQKRCIRKDLGTKTQGEGMEYCNMDAAKMKELQEQDLSLSEAREAARKAEGTKGEWFYREGLLYRRWTPRGRGEESEVEQLVLPKACRHVALVMSHDIPIAGHLGRDKTRQRLLRRFFWPTVFRDVEEYCKTCGVCQKATQKGVKKAPLVPLTDLTKKSMPNSVVWNDKCEDAFKVLKDMLCSDPVLNSPDFKKGFIVQTDASDRGVGAVLTQVGVDGQEHPVGYFSRKLLPREQRYSTIEKECLAIKLSLDAFKVYLLGRNFVVQTDHRALEWMERLKENNARLCRWSLSLQPYSFVVQHRPGAQNLNADALSRNPAMALLQEKGEEV